jgi:predicted DNA-binding protein (MmcQ/YjbR family)
VRFSPKAGAKRVRELSLSLPETYEDSPWGFPVFKVGDNKLFAMLTGASPLEVTMKVGAEEREIGALLPFVRPASHVGRYGWVTVTVEDEAALQTALDWVRESYWLKAPATVREAAFR